MKNWKRILSSVLVFCLLAGFAPSAFAAEDSTELVYADSGESVTVGNVTVTGEGDAALANAYDGGSASITVEGSVTQTAENASVSPVDVYSSGEGSVAAVNISGDVSVQGNDSTGVSASGSDGGSAQVQVDGKVDVEGDQSADGIQAFANNNASVVISVGEGIDASVSSDNSEYSSATGVSSVSSTGSTIDIDVNGDVSAESGMYSTGVSSSAHSDGKADINISYMYSFLLQGKGIIVFRTGDTDKLIKQFHHNRTPFRISDLIITGKKGVYKYRKHFLLFCSGEVDFALMKNELVQVSPDI